MTEATEAPVRLTSGPRQWWSWRGPAHDGRRRIRSSVLVGGCVEWESPVDSATTDDTEAVDADGSRTMSVTEVADVLKVTDRSVRRMCEEGRLSAEKSGKTWSIDADSRPDDIRTASGCRPDRDRTAHGPAVIPLAEFFVVFDRLANLEQRVVRAESKVEDLEERFVVTAHISDHGMPRAAVPIPPRSRPPTAAEMSEVGERLRLEGEARPHAVREHCGGRGLSRGLV